MLPQDVPPHLVLARLRLPGPRLRVVALRAQPDHPPRRRVLDRTHQRFHFEVQLRFLFLRTTSLSLLHVRVGHAHVVVEHMGAHLALAALLRLVEVVTLCAAPEGLPRFRVFEGPHSDFSLLVLLRPVPLGCGGH